jgi:hypothetical protein
MTVMSSLLLLLLAMATSSLHKSMDTHTSGITTVDALGNSFLVGHLAPEAVGCEDEEGAVGRDVEARHLRLR